MDAGKLALALVLIAPLLPSTVHADECNPYPVGRCGAFDREIANFCYIKVGGVIVDATDHHVMAIGGSKGVALPDNSAMGDYYVRLAPTEGFANDPYESDLPTSTLVEETNGLRGAQLAPFRCADFQWWAECNSWMGPYNIQPEESKPMRPPDEIMY